MESWAMMEEFCAELVPPSSMFTLRLLIPLLLEQQASYQQKATLNTSATSDCCGLVLAIPFQCHPCSLKS